MFTGGYTTNGTVTNKVSSYMMKKSWESFKYKDWFDKVKLGKAFSLHNILFYIFLTQPKVWGKNHGLFQGQVGFYIVNFDITNN